MEDCFRVDLCLGCSSGVFRLGTSRSWFRDIGGDCLGIVGRDILVGGVFQGNMGYILDSFCPEALVCEPACLGSFLDTSWADEGFEDNWGNKDSVGRILEFFEWVAEGG